MQILIESSEYWLRNNGDLAMFEVTINRIRARWPLARIGVLTDSPSLLRAFFPAAEGMTVFDHNPWAETTLTEKLAAQLGAAVVGPVALARLRTKVWLPAKLRGARRRLKRKLFPHKPVVEHLAPNRPHIGSFRAVREADLVIALGGGYFTDADKPQAERVLNLFEHALAHKVPVAMVGQGFGPITDPELTARCAEVLPRLDFIALRERRRGPKLLADMGVGTERVLVTGDDAIELAHDVATDVLGDGVGICLRIAGYSPVEQSVADTVGRVVREFAADRNAPLIPLIIAEYRSQDRRSTLPLVRNASDVVPPLPRYVSARQVAERVGRCRVLVTGAYHLAVFALSQGIPVVAVTSSEYYDDKFLGLADMFGQGLTHIRLADVDLADRLAEAVTASWSAAEAVRQPLRGRAREQIALSREGFDRVHALLGQASPEHA